MKLTTACTATLIALFLTTPGYCLDYSDSINFNAPIDEACFHKEYNKLRNMLLEGKYERGPESLRKNSSEVIRHWKKKLVFINLNDKEFSYPIHNKGHHFLIGRTLSRRIFTTTLYSKGELKGRPDIDFSKCIK